MTCTVSGWLQMNRCPDVQIWLHKRRCIGVRYNGGIRDIELRTHEVTESLVSGHLYEHCVQMSGSAHEFGLRYLLFWREPSRRLIALKDANPPVHPKLETCGGTRPAEPTQRNLIRLAATKHPTLPPFNRAPATQPQHFSMQAPDHRQPLHSSYWRVCQYPQRIEPHLSR